MASAVPERIRWSVDVLAPGPEEHLLEIGCGPGVAVALVCERLAGGRIVAIDRSATAIARATRRNAQNIASGRALLRRAALEQLTPADLPGARTRFDKVFAMNVNLFWTRSPARELDLIRTLLAPGAALYLFYGYGSPPGAPTTPRVPATLIERLTEHGFTTGITPGPGVVCVRTTPERPGPAGGR
jgi:SAM-dependent methyltransferase